MSALASFGTDRILALGLASASLLAMLCIGLYQSRTIDHLHCPGFGDGCEVVADAPFARPFGMPDGYIAAALYGVIVLLLFGPIDSDWIWIPLSALATIANVQGVRDMMKLGRYCFYCLLTTVSSPALLASVWLLR